MIDTHAHLCDQIFSADRSIVLANARRVGIKTIISVSENLEDSKINLKLSEVHPEILPAAGLYPAILDTNLAEKVCQFIERNYEKLAAIGEVGLDYRVVEEEKQREVQRSIFEEFIQLSLTYNLPLNVHSRSAGKHAIKLLLQKGARKVQLHAFDGKASSALPAVEAGYFFSIPPSIVRSRQKQKLVKHLPPSSLLLETDSPVLGPDSDRRNEPANLPIVLRAVAEIKGISQEELLEIVTLNTFRLYNLC